MVRLRSQKRFSMKSVEFTKMELEVENQRLQNRIIEEETISKAIDNFTKIYDSSRSPGDIKLIEDVIEEIRNVK